MIDMFANNVVQFGQAFKQNGGGAKGLNLPSILEETLVYLTNTWGNICLEAQADFLLKIF